MDTKNLPIAAQLYIFSKLPDRDERMPEILDVGWIWRTGNDPAAFLRPRRRAVELPHLRDFRGETAVPLGQGDVPLKHILAEVPALPNLKAIVIEQNPTSADPLADMRASLEWLTSEG